MNWPVKATLRGIIAGSLGRRQILLPTTLIDATYNLIETLERERDEARNRADALAIAPEQVTIDEHDDGTTLPQAAETDPG